MRVIERQPYSWWQRRRLDLTCLLLDLGFPRLAYFADPTTPRKGR